MTKEIQVYNRYINQSFGELISFDGSKYVWNKDCENEFFIFDLPTGRRAVQVKDIKSFKHSILTTNFEINEDIINAYHWQDYLINDSV